jgi:hypothetical protein
VRCNYKRLRDRMVRRLRELAEERYTIRELTLPESVTTLYTTIQTYGHGMCPDNEPCPALFVLGIESVVALDDLLTSSNQVRDEFRKRLPFPLVLWVNDEVLASIVRFAPDFASWAATPIRFEIATTELIDFYGKRQTPSSILSSVLGVGDMPLGAFVLTIPPSIWQRVVVLA